MQNTELLLQHSLDT